MFNFAVLECAFGLLMGLLSREYAFGPLARLLEWRHAVEAFRELRWFTEGKEMEERRLETDWYVGKNIYISCQTE